jgi:hypothetical protein
LCAKCSRLKESLAKRCLFAGCRSGSAIIRRREKRKALPWRFAPQHFLGSQRSGGALIWALWRQNKDWAALCVAARAVFGASFYL